MKLAILGNSGSGKSTLARRLAGEFGLAHLDLDTVAWKPGQVAVARDPVVARREVMEFCAREAAWVVEGCYGGLIGELDALGAELVFLDPGVEVCLEYCRRRPFEAHKFASPAEQDRHLEFLLEWVRGYETRVDDLSRGAHEALFAAWRGPKVRLIEQAAIEAFGRER